MSKKTSKKEDMLSQLKKEENKHKKNQAKEEVEESSEEEEDQNESNAIKEQSIKKSDKPKTLKDLLNSMDETKPKQKKKPEPEKTKKNNDEPQKMTFYNSKGAGKFAEIEKDKNKKVYKNAKGLDNAAKENQKIKPTKNYLEKDVKKEYEENIEKPQFKSNKDKEENFVELNKKEDVRIKIFILNLIYIYSYSQKNSLVKNSKKMWNIMKTKIKKEEEKKIILKKDTIKKKVMNQ